MLLYLQQLLMFFLKSLSDKPKAMQSHVNAAVNKAATCDKKKNMCISQTQENITPSLLSLSCE
jgi:hypothetical protein